MYATDETNSRSMYTLGQSTRVYLQHEVIIFVWKHAFKAWFTFTGSVTIAPVFVDGLYDKRMRTT